MTRPRDLANPTNDGWTIATYAIYVEALRAADERIQEERDRRYAEVNVEKEKALKIKETADLAALQLAREIQTYKDEKANELREQINSERGLYATKDDLDTMGDKVAIGMKPLSDYISSQQGRQQGIQLSTTNLFALITVVVGLIGAAYLIAGK